LVVTVNTVPVNVPLPVKNLVIAPRFPFPSETTLQIGREVTLSSDGRLQMIPEVKSVPPSKVKTAGLVKVKTSPPPVPPLKVKTQEAPKVKTTAPAKVKITEPGEVKTPSDAPKVKSRGPKAQRIARRAAIARIRRDLLAVTGRNRPLPKSRAV
jgi:hypothetical protein